MNHEAPATDDGSHRDRSLGLVFFGSLEIVIGLALLTLVPLSLAAFVLTDAVELHVVLPTTVLYCALAALFITLGVGSVRARRWACALSLSMAWVWLITGVCTLALAWLLIPGLWRDLAVTAGLSHGAAQTVNIGINLILATMYVLLPGGFVLFYRSPAVAATCRRRDPHPGWVGRCPQRLLALSVAFALGGLSVLAMPAYGYVFPVFGVLASGPAGAVCWAAVLVLSMALAWGTCRRQRWAWRLAVAATVATAISTITTFMAVDAGTALAAMNLPPEQRMLLEQIWPTSPWAHALGWVAVWGSLLAYLLVVRPLFGPSGADDEG